MGTAATPKAQHWDNQLRGRVRYPSYAPTSPLRHPPNLSLQDEQIPKSQCSCPGRGNNTKGHKAPGAQRAPSPKVNIPESLNPIAEVVLGRGHLWIPAVCAELCWGEAEPREAARAMCEIVGRPQLFLLRVSTH